MRSNPHARGFPQIGLLAEFPAPGKGEILHLCLYDRREKNPEDALIAFGRLYFVKGKGWETTFMGASPGFGPMLYETAALILQAPVHASTVRSQDAISFWGRQKEAFIRPMTVPAWEEKYAVSFSAACKAPPRRFTWDRLTAGFDNLVLHSDRNQADVAPFEFPWSVKHTDQAERSRRRQRAQKRRPRSWQEELGLVLPSLEEIDFDLE